jgi:hypothetical protein
MVGSVTVGYEARPVSYSVGTRPLLSGVKRPGREADLPPPSGASAWRNTPELHYILILWSLNDSLVMEHQQERSDLLANDDACSDTK